MLKSYKWDGWMDGMDGKFPLEISVSTPSTSTALQTSLICGVIDDNLQKAIDKCVFTYFRDKNAIQLLEYSNKTSPSAPSSPP